MDRHPFQVIWSFVFMSVSACRLEPAAKSSVWTLYDLLCLPYVISVKFFKLEVVFIITLLFCLLENRHQKTEDYFVFIGQLVVPYFLLLCNSTMTITSKMIIMFHSICDQKPITWEGRSFSLRRRALYNLSRGVPPLDITENSGLRLHLYFSRATTRVFMNIK